jgi:hypothetical protein
MLIGDIECADKVKFAHNFYRSFHITRKFKKMKPILWRGNGHVEDEFDRQAILSKLVNNPGHKKIF